MAVTNGWGKGAQNNTNGWGKSGTNNIGYGAIYESSAAGDTSIIGTSAAFLYSKSSFNQGEADPTPTITGTAGGSFNASANVVFVDTGTFNSSTGQIDLSATTIDSHIITYTVDGVQSGQTVGVESIPYASTSSFSFDGINDYYFTGFTNFPANLNDNFSVSFWVKMAPVSVGTYKRVHPASVSQNVSDIDQTVHLRAWNTQYKVRIVGSVSGGGVGTTDISDNQWHHILYTYNYDASTTYYTVNIYVDGNSTPEVTSVMYTAPYLQQGFRTIGVLSDQASPYALNSGTYFSGNLDEVSIWNTTLSQSAVTEIYNSGAPNDLTTLTNASNTNLKAWYKF